MLCLSCDSRDGVDVLNDMTARNGGTADINPKQDLGLMYSRNLTDLEDHVWEMMWMDISPVPRGGNLTQANGQALRARSNIGTRVELGRLTTLTQGLQIKQMRQDHGSAGLACHWVIDEAAIARSQKGRLPKVVPAFARAADRPSDDDKGVVFNRTSLCAPANTLQA